MTARPGGPRRQNAPAARIGARGPGAGAPPSGVGELPAGAEACRPRLGLIVNPIAGMGGRVGLKGTDDATTLAEALSRGATPVAPARALLCLRLVAERCAAGTTLLTAAGQMGELEAGEAGLAPGVVLPLLAAPSTTAADTRAAAREIVKRGVDLILFVGGDGTARDILEAIGDEVPTLGVPAGVKMHSAVFATSPRAAADVACAYLADPEPSRCLEEEVMDIDEAAARRGEVSARLLGYLRVPPAARLLQGLKVATDRTEATNLSGLAAEVVRRLPTGAPHVFGPGTTTRAVAQLLGIPKTLLGVDVAVIDDRFTPIRQLVVADATEADLLGAVGEGSRVVVSPIGGQGFVFGRGNQQISPAVLRAVGVENIVVVATPAKLAALAGRPLLVDTGDSELDADIAGYVRVITGPGAESVCQIAPG